LVYAAEAPLTDATWVTPEALTTYPISRGFQKILAKLRHNP
jgi:hypothetical protein